MNVQHEWRMKNHHNCTSFTLCITIVLFYLFLQCNAPTKKHLIAYSFDLIQWTTLCPKKRAACCLLYRLLGRQLCCYARCLANYFSWTFHYRFISPELSCDHLIVLAATWIHYYERGGWSKNFYHAVCWDWDIRVLLLEQLVYTETAGEWQTLGSLSFWYTLQWDSLKDTFQPFASCHRCWACTIWQHCWMSMLTSVDQTAERRCHCSYYAPLLLV